jgi:hypothetical protein
MSVVDECFGRIGGRTDRVGVDLGGVQGCTGPGGLHLQPASTRDAAEEAALEAAPAEPRPRAEPRALFGGLVW